MLHHRKLIIVGANEKSLSLLDQEIMLKMLTCFHNVLDFSNFYKFGLMNSTISYKNLVKN